MVVPTSNGASLLFRIEIEEKMLPGERGNCALGMIADYAQRCRARQAAG